LNDVLNFDITEFQFQKFLDEETALLKIKVCSSGNNKHNVPFTNEILIEAAESSLRGKAIVAKYNRWTDDFQGHSPTQVPLGYFIENQDFEYVDNSDGTISLFAYAILWKKYAIDAYNVFLEDDVSKRPVSMEIKAFGLPKDWATNGKVNPATGFKFQGVTILGEKYTPASVGAEATMVMFAEKKEEVEKLFFEKKSIKIDNSKDSAVDGKWTNPNRKLYKPILDASNTKALLNEAYLIVDSDYEDNPSGALHYPHHVIRDGKLVVHIGGVQSAFARAKQQGLTGKPIDHLKRHYKELGLNTVDFEVKEDENVPKVNVDFGLTINQTRDILSSAISEFKYGENEWRKYWVTDFDEEYVYLYDNEEDKIYRCSYSIAENVATVDLESKVEVIRGGYEVVGENKPEGESVNYETKCSELEAKMSEMETTISDMKTQIATFETENKELKEFKVKIEEQQKSMLVENVIAEFSEIIPKDKLDELREKGKTVENVDAFKNEVKALAFDYIDTKDNKSGIQRMAVHNNDLPPKKKFW
jgi:hypothetical protein